MNLREQKAAKKREDILRSASLVISRQGYHNATMEDIAAELLMTKGALYYYFKNKEELLYRCHELILTEAKEKMLAITEADLPSVEKMRKAIHHHIEVAIREKEVFNLIVKPETTFSKDNIPEIIEKRDEYAELFDRIIDEGIVRGEFEVPEKKMARMIILGATNWIQVWYSPEGKYSAEDVEEIYAEHLLKMLRKTS
ncbi:TetR/AcrR family transcriptional regulator [Planococcus sp. ISL-109]|uniref:TetR/AcrR family transcriptional regulator n=1 Tax=Planococcus sp. ISL-109 TaxID=2819166 RepID=UPI001BEA5B73|nr:TetR/AcrR family transcriptional regulator [Planococcus sp. ISL-109]MBT2582665.1 TetR family transcriptional regulator [Planococcus sp. ISL-109]